MNNLLTLTKFNLKLYLKPNLKTKKEKRTFIGLIVFCLVCFIAPIINIIGLLYNFSQYAAQNGCLKEVTSLLFLIVQVMNVFFGTITYFQLMYNPKDASILANLPVKNIEIFISKMIVVYVSELFTSLLIMIPSIIVINIGLANVGHSLSFAYYLGALIGIILLPLIPLFLIALIGYPIMLIMNFSKKRPLVGSILTIILMIVLITAIYIPIFKSNMQIDDSYQDESGMPVESGTVVEEEEIETSDYFDVLFDSLSQSGNLETLIKIGKYSIFTYMLSSAMFETKIVLNLFLFILSSIAIAAIGLVIANLLYKSISKTFIDSGTVETIKTNGVNVQQSAKKSLLMKEIKSNLRNPQIMMTVIMSILFPALFSGIFCYVMGGMQMDAEDANIVKFMGLGMSYLFTYMFCSGVSSTAAIPFSLEGENFNILKILPLSSKDIIKTKIFFNDIVSIIATILAAIVITIFAKPNILEIVFFVVNITLVGLSIGAFATLRDAKNPKTKWTNIKEITKNNFSTIVPMLLAMIPGFVAMILTIMLAEIMAEMNTFLVSLIKGGVLLVIGIVYYLIFRKSSINKAVKAFDEVEA